MRMLRNVLSIVVTLMVALGAATAVPRAAVADTKPGRVVAEDDPGDHQVTFNAFRLKGQVTEPTYDALTGLPVIDPVTGQQAFAKYAKEKVKLQRKKCGKCKWKTTKTIKTNKFGTFKTRIYAPRKGRWKWRVKVPSSNGYAVSKGRTWTTGFK